MIKIAIADDHRLFRETLAELLRTQKDLTIVALCQNSDETIAAVSTQDPDLVLMDMKMTPLSGLHTTEKIRQFSAVKIIGLSMYALPLYASNMFTAGANGYLTKNSSVEEIVTAINVVMTGKKYIGKEVVDLKIEEDFSLEQEVVSITMLTAREMEVAQLVRKGYSSKQIALELGCKYQTAGVHRNHILKKLHVKNTNELVDLLHRQAPDL